MLHNSRTQTEQRRVDFTFNFRPIAQSTARNAAQLARSGYALHDCGFGTHRVLEPMVERAPKLILTSQLPRGVRLEQRLRLGNSVDEKTQGAKAPNFF